MDRLRKQAFEGYCMKNFLNNVVNKHRFLKECRDRYTTEHEKEPYSRPTPIMNLLGYCHWKLDDPNKARGYFVKCLAKDPNNLNALLNLVYISKQLGIGTDAAKYDETIEKLLDESDESKLDLYKARLVFENATVMSCIDEFYNRQDRDVVIKRFQYAFELAGDCINTYEKDEWLFGFGFLYTRMDTPYGKETDDYFKAGVRCFYQVITSPGVVSEDEEINTRQNDRIAKSWMLIATLFSRYSSRHKLHLGDVIGDVVRDEHRHFDMIQCCEKAEGLLESPAVLGRLGQAYMKMKSMPKAKDCLDKALEKQPSGYCYQLLGQWFVETYKAEKNIEHITEAIKCFEKAKKLRCNLPSMYKGLIEAYIFDKKLEDASLVCFDCSQNSSFSHKSEFHDLWAEVLEKNGQKEGAAQKRHHAERLRKAAGAEIKSFAFGAVYCEEDQMEVDKIVHYIEKKNHVDGYFYDRDKHPGKIVSAQWRDMVSKCRMLFVFVSEDFCNDEDSEAYHLIDKQNLDIIPIRIKGYTGELPGLRLSNKTPITYDENNIDKFQEEMVKVFKMTV